MPNHPNRSQARERQTISHEDVGQFPAEVLKPPGTALEVVDFGDLAGYGTEGLGIDDQPTPLLRILHYQCPQIDRADPKFIHGAAPGMICDVSIGEVWEGQETGLDIVVCGTKRRYQRWIPRPRPGLQIVRQRSGNFRGFLETDDPIVGPLLSRHGKFAALPRSNEDGETEQLVETGELFVLFGPPPLTHEGAQRAMVNFQSTSLGTWKMYNRRHESFRFPQPGGSMRQGPLCFWRWRLRSQPVSNDQGKFFVWSIELAVRSMRQYREGRVQEYRPDDDAQGGGGPVVDPDAPPF